MPNDLSFLTEQPSEFLSKIAILREEKDELIELEAYYAVEAYDRFLFDACDIDFPPKLTNAVPKRQSEFLAGRILARAALERLHRAYVPIAIGEWGYPVWPRGISGSISHSHGKCACLVVADEAKLVGIDIEKVSTGASLEAILQEALNLEERQRVFEQTAFDAAVLATLIFSAKETVYKTLYPLVRTFFGFEAAVFNGIRGNNIASLSIAHSLHDAVPHGKEISIQFEIDGEFVKTWSILERDMQGSLSARPPAG